MPSRTPRQRTLSPPRPPETAAHLAELPTDTPLTIADSIVEVDVQDLHDELSEIRRCRFTKSAMVGMQLAKATIVDVDFDHCDLAGGRITKSSLTRVRFTGCRLSALDLSETTFTDVEFRDCVLDWANFRMTKGTTVRASTCGLVNADFAGAELSGLSLLGCDLTDATFAGSKCLDVALHRSTLERTSGLLSLRNVTIGSDQQLPYALQLLPDLNVVVDDDDEPSST